MILTILRRRIQLTYMFERLRSKTKGFIQKGEECLADKDTEFLVFLPATDYYYLPYFQLFQYKNVHVEFSFSNGTLAISKLLGLFSFQSPYKKYSKVKYDQKKKYIIFFDGQYALASSEFRHYLQQEYPGCKIIFHLGDLIKTKTGIDIDNIKAFADLVVTYDHNDADENQLTYHADPYSQLPKEMVDGQYEKSGIIFYGFAKNRATEIMQVYDKLKNNHITCDFSIPDLDEEFTKERPELANAHFTPYLEYLKRVQGTDCLLEIIQKGSRGCTFRTWEAIAYNKKLITNNPSVVDEKFYNPQFIQVIDSIDSLDVDWIKQDVKVDYGFADDLSPRACFEYYLGQLKQKE